MNDAVAPSTSPQDPATGAGGEANTPQVHVPQAAMTDPPYAVVVTVITRDSIRQQAILQMGGRHTASREFHRTGQWSWRATQNEFIAAEERIGLELAEYMDQLDLPTRVANMLPHANGTPHSDARRRAAEEVEAMRHD